MLQLKHQMIPCFSGSMINKLFHHDFKFHLEAITHLSEVLLFCCFLFEFVVSIEKIFIYCCHSASASCLLHQMYFFAIYDAKILHGFKYFV